MYPPPIGVLPITGLNVVGLGLTAGALIVTGVVFVRAAYFARSRRHH